MNAMDDDEKEEAIITALCEAQTDRDIELLIEQQSELAAIGFGGGLDDSPFHTELLLAAARVACVFISDVKRERDES